MKIIYVTARWDPKDPDSGAGVNYNAYQILHHWADEVKIAGPFQSRLSYPERVFRKISQLFTRERLVKFYPSYIKKSNQAVQKIIDDFQPDAIFSKASIPLVNVKLNAPLIYMCDSTVKWVKKNWPHFSKLGFWFMERWEKKVIDKAAHILTFSSANANILINKYHKPEEKISVHPIPSSLPKEFSKYQEREFGPGEVLKLILVGKNYHGKGVDIAIDTTQKLNQEGIPTKLRIVGQDGTNSENVQFMGLYSKNNPNELLDYIQNYQWAHFHIFPSRFDAAGIVASEAAGLGVPTVTNATGGLATTVKDGVSGIVLPEGSSADAYMNVLRYFYANQKDYLKLCKTTYDRYQTELNWESLGNHITQIIKDMVNLRRN